MKSNQVTILAKTENTISVMSLLKSETLTVHRQLERNICLSSLFQPDYSIEKYRGLLEKFYGFFCAIEPLIFASLDTADEPILNHRKKSSLLAIDLSLLGTGGDALASLTRCERLPLLDTYARRMGALYVLEGSTLGGKIISKRLKDHFGEFIADKLNYYQSYGDNLMFEWSAFQNFMSERFDGKEDQIEHVVSAAIETFIGLDRWLGQA